MRKQLLLVLAPLSKTNIDSDESANYDGRLFPPVCMRDDVYTRSQYVFDSGRYVLRFKAYGGWA